MTGVIRVLQLEDNSRDAKLIQDTLEAGGLMCKFAMAKNKAEFERLVTAGYDIFLSDYALPGYDGITAVQLFKELHPGVPVIMVSGVLGEEAAVQSLKLGVDDYILKHNLKRLPHAVEEALAHFEEKAAHASAEQELDEATAHEVALLEMIPDIIMEVDNDKVYTWANEAGIAFFGDDVIGKEASFYFEGEQKTYDVVKPVFTGSKETVYVESWQRRKDGQRRLLAWHCRTLRNAKGEVSGAISSALDITERKQAENALLESEEKFRHVFESSNVGKSLTLVTGEINVNKAFADMLGYTEDELRGKTWQELTPPDEIEATQKIIDSLINGEKDFGPFHQKVFA